MMRRLGLLVKILWSSDPDPTELWGGITMLLWSGWLAWGGIDFILDNPERATPELIATLAGWVIGAIILAIFRLDALSIEWARGRMLGAAISFCAWTFIMTRFLGGRDVATLIFEPLYITQAMGSAWVYIRLWLHEVNRA